MNDVAKILRKVPKVLTPRLSLLIGGAFFLLMVAIGAIPGEATELSAKIPDKLLHFTAYSFLTCCIYRSLSCGLLSRAVRTVMIVGVLGALDENIQRFMPYRSCDLKDWIFDLLAAFFSVVVLSFIFAIANPKVKAGSRTI
jgi:VanZ family protein